MVVVFLFVYRPTGLLLEIHEFMFPLQTEYCRPGGKHVDLVTIVI